MTDLAELNPQQREAVTHGDGPLLVLAGAGSGKTRVITYRIAHLISEKRVPPPQILAVTFTNKAAEEMLGRVNRLIPQGLGRPMIGTFHSTAVRILRRYADRLGYAKSFVIYDSADQQTLVRRSLRELNLDEDAFPPRSVLSRISRAKNELIGPAQFEKDNRDFYGVRIGEVYRRYQSRLREYDAMDFDDLIGNFVELLTSHADVRDELRARFRHLLIDEYQDTNRAQYMLIKGLAGESGNVVAVGDEDQSIYGFRGADINNILNFERDFPGAKVIKLEQNYRSTSHILDAATGVVSRNVARKGKRLFTESGHGKPVRVVSLNTDREEAQYVVNKIREMQPDIPLRDIAVLFRTNAQSRPFEEELLAANYPYVVVGGVKFYERAEIKDTMAYLRASVRPHDTPSLERIINVPARGIGDTTLKALTDRSAADNSSLWTVIEGELDFLTDRARRSVREFREILHDLQRAASQPLPEFLDYVLIRTGYKRVLTESRDPQDESRLENLAELMNSAREFYEANPESSLGDYLDSVSLISDVDQYDNEKGITLMTLHAAKGLEFRVVFLAGMEEGILPHAQSKEDIEEERRLCYVGMTRAREQLYCLHTYQRRVHGQFREQSPSPFLDEIPEEVREAVGVQPVMARRSFLSGSGGYRSSTQGHDTVRNVAGFFKNAPVKFDPTAFRSKPEGRPRDLRRGARVRHEQFGDGVILRMEGEGGDAKLTVYFDRGGTRKFIARYAKLTLL